MNNNLQWRKGPKGTKTLCNACGIKWLRSQGKAAKKKEANKEKLVTQPKMKKSKNGEESSFTGSLLLYKRVPKPKVVN